MALICFPEPFQRQRLSSPEEQKATGAAQNILPGFSSQESICHSRL